MAVHKKFYKRLIISGVKKVKLANSELRIEAST